MHIFGININTNIYSYLTFSLNLIPILLHLPFSFSIFFQLYLLLLFSRFYFTSLLFALSSSRRITIKEMANCSNREENYFSSQDQEAAPVGKKYGELVPKKKPLISKDHERAFFDSADWALCKQGAGMNQISTNAVETLRPKLQRTPHQQLPPRRPACTSGRESMGQ